MSKHTITTELEVTVSAYGIDPETFYPEVQIEFGYTPGYPEIGPSYASGGEPATPDEIEIHSVTVTNREGIDMPPEWWRERAQEWLDDKGYDAARKIALSDNEPDPDDMRDRMRDDAP
jgi:hypothetical protein